MEQYMPYIWIAFAVLMAVCEGVTTQLVSIWFVLGAIAAAVTTIFTSSVFVQLVVFLVVSMLALVITRPIVKRLKKGGEAVSTNAKRLIGCTGTVISPIEDTESVGQVKVLGEIWSAVSEKAPIEKNTKITVLAIEGVKLIVEPTN